MTESGLLKIVAIKSLFKKGLNSNLLSAFPGIESLKTPSYSPPIHLLNPTWLSGFISAEGCFNALVQLNVKYKVGYRFRIRFILDQKDELLFMTQVLSFFGVGRIEKRVNNNFRFIVDTYNGCFKIKDYLNFMINYYMFSYRYS